MSVDWSSLEQTGVAVKKVVTMHDVSCQRCGYSWTAKNESIPPVCPECRHRRWYTTESVPLGRPRRSDRVRDNAAARNGYLKGLARGITSTRYSKRMVTRGTRRWNEQNVKTE